MRFAALLLVVLQASLSLAQDLGPEELARKVTAEVLEMIRSDKQLQAGDRGAVTALLEQKLLPLVDFQEAAKIAVGSAWRAATPEQQERIVQELRAMVVRIFTNTVSTYGDQNVRVAPLKLPPGATVATVRNQYFRPGRPPIAVEYEMHKIAAGWRIYDVKFDGVSIALTYRADFEQIVKEGGIEGLIRRMAEKNLPPVAK